MHQNTYSNLDATTLTQEAHERTCGYWFTVTNSSTAHTAFRSRAGLDRWLTERGLSLESELPDAGTFGRTRIVGEYRTVSHGEFLSDDPRDGMGEGDFYALKPVAVTAEPSNGAYTLALITEEGGVRVVNTLNPNVRTRVVLDYRAAAHLMDPDPAQ